MLYELSEGIFLKVNSELENDISNFLVERRTPLEIVGSKELIECIFTQPDSVDVIYKERHFKCQRKNWIAQLFQILPSVYIDTYPTFLFLHGSCFCYNNKIVFLLGKSRSGKSTALYSILCNNNDVRYISDDIIAIDLIEKCLLPLSNKPIQLREDVVSTEDYILVDDAWNMKKVAYYSPQEKETKRLLLKDHQIVYCFIKYHEGSKIQVNSMNNYDFLNSLFQCCFSISKVTISMLASIISQNTKAISVVYDGNIKELLEVIL